MTVTKPQVVQWLGSEEPPAQLVAHLRSRAVLLQSRNDLDHAAPRLRLLSTAVESGSASLAGHHLAILHPDPGAADLLAQRARDAGAKVLVVSLRPEAIARTDAFAPEAVLMEAQDLVGACWDITRALWTHSRLRRTPIILAPDGSLQISALDAFDFGRVGQTVREVRVAQGRVVQAPAPANVARQSAPQTAPASTPAEAAQSAKTSSASWPAARVASASASQPNVVQNARISSPSWPVARVASGVAPAVAATNGAWAADSTSSRVSGGELQPSFATEGSVAVALDFESTPWTSPSLVGLAESSAHQSGVSIIDSGLRATFESVDLARARIVQTFQTARAHVSARERALSRKYLRIMGLLVLACALAATVAIYRASDAGSKQAPTSDLKVTVTRFPIAPAAAPDADATAIDDLESAAPAPVVAPEAVRRASQLVNEGHDSRRRGMLEAAEKSYRAALVVFPRYPRALSGLARLAIEKRDGAAAVRFARALVRARPQQTDNILLLGDAYRTAGDPARAKTAWKAAAKRGNRLAKQRLRE